MGNIGPSADADTQPSASDLFGHPVTTPTRKTTLFGEGLDALARERGGWPGDALLFGVEVVGKGENPMVLATGGVPVGWRADGQPKFGPRKDDLRAGFTIAEYRGALRATTAPSPALGGDEVAASDGVNPNTPAPSALGGEND